MQAPAASIDPEITAADSSRKNSIVRETFLMKLQRRDAYKVGDLISQFVQPKTGWLHHSVKLVSNLSASVVPTSRKTYNYTVARILIILIGSAKSRFDEISDETRNVGRTPGGEIDRGKHRKSTKPG